MTSYASLAHSYARTARNIVLTERSTLENIAADSRLSPAGRREMAAPHIAKIQTALAEARKDLDRELAEARERVEFRSPKQERRRAALKDPAEAFALRQLVQGLPPEELRALAGQVADAAARGTLDERHQRLAYALSTMSGVDNPRGEDPGSVIGDVQAKLASAAGPEYEDAVAELVLIQHEALSLAQAEKGADLLTDPLAHLNGLREASTFEGRHFNEEEIAQMRSRLGVPAPILPVIARTALEAHAEAA